MAAPAKNTAAQTQAKTDATSVKAGVKERKKPVRTAPAQKDYPTKLAWLKAMTEHEEAEATKANAAKVARLDQRLAAARSAVANATAKVIELEAERAKLVPEETESEDEGFDEFEIANGRDQA